MAGDPGVEAGVRAVCPSCGNEVMQHSMIPLLRDGVQSYVCVACARQLVAVGAAGADGAGTEAADDTEADEVGSGA